MSVFSGLPAEWSSEQKCPRCGSLKREFDSEAVGASVLEYLGELGKDQAWLAKQMGLSQPYMNLLGKGKRRWSPTLITRLVNVQKTNPVQRD